MQIHWIFQHTERDKDFLSGDCLSPCGNWDFRQGSQHHGLLQTNKRHEGRVQEVHLPHQHVRCLRVSRQLLHELVPQLWEPAGEETLNVRFTPARFPVVIKQTIFKGDAAVQVKYQTRRPLFLSCRGGVRMETRHLLGPSWSTFNPQINTPVFQERLDHCNSSFSIAIKSQTLI